MFIEFVWKVTVMWLVQVFQNGLLQLLMLWITICQMKLKPSLQTETDLKEIPSELIWFFCPIDQAKWVLALSKSGTSPTKFYIHTSHQMPWV